MGSFIRSISLLSAGSFFLLGCMTSPAVSGEPTSPALGYDIHVQAPHMMPNGEPGGPFHHYCKGISDKILH